MIRNKFKFRFEKETTRLNGISMVCYKNKIALILFALIINNNLTVASAPVKISSANIGFSGFKTLITQKYKDTLSQSAQKLPSKIVPAPAILNQTDAPCSGQDPDAGPCNVKNNSVSLKNINRSRKSGKVSDRKYFDWKAYTPDANHLPVK